MEIRVLKTVLTGFVGLMALLYAAQNLVNLEQAYGAVATVTSMHGHEIYPASLGPSVESSLFVWLALGTILIGEITTGILASKGVWDLWQARKSKGADFNAAKKYAVLGCGMGMVVWFGLFGVIGGAYFQMWQTDVGALSLEGAFQYAGGSGLILLFINMKDD